MMTFSWGEAVAGGVTGGTCIFLRRERRFDMTRFTVVLPPVGTVIGGRRVRVTLITTVASVTGSTALSTHRSL